MKVTEKQIRKIIREALLREGLPSEYDDEWAEEESLADDADYADGLEDAKNGLPIRKDASPAYLEGRSDGEEGRAAAGDRLVGGLPTEEDWDEYPEQAQASREAAWEERNY